MKRPQTPPYHDQPLTALTAMNHAQLLHLFQADIGPCDAKGRYLRCERALPSLG